MNSKRLTSVLRIRQIQERSARGELAACRRANRLAAQAEHRTWRLLDERVATPHQSQTAAATLADRAVVDAGMLAAETQHTTTETSAAEALVAADHWTVAARRVEGLERLAERTALTENEESARRASNEIDDLVLVRFAGGMA
jgi:flagellar export protein FliJ